MDLESLDMECQLYSRSVTTVWKIRSSMTLLEKAMATHSSTLAWKIPWMEECGRLQSMESQRVGHDWETSLSLSWPATKLPSWLSGEEFICQAGVADLIPVLGRSRGEGRQPTPIFLPGKFHGQTKQVGYSIWGHKESDTV